jgi:hypothetical protein
VKDGGDQRRGRGGGCGDGGLLLWVEIIRHFEVLHHHGDCLPSLLGRHTRRLGNGLEDLFDVELHDSLPFPAAMLG